MSITRMHDFFSNFCVFQTDGTNHKAFLYANEFDARNKRYELDSENVNIIGNIYNKYKNNEYDNEFSKLSMRNTDIFRVCKFMDPEKQKIICIKKGNYFYNS